ncbi:LIC11113 family protein [Leptospira yasudae]|uniref:LIC11113 family protein n=1 Tax=Leptospira yasudae TaxID=2202201 RepID=UPI001090C1BD|nr:hypothetical protein [Leptospira yasudae]TGM99419.1 hypothetical protein EHR10_11160 [Leptospira yasudae]
MIREFRIVRTRIRFFPAALRKTGEWFVWILAGFVLFLGSVGSESEPERTPSEKFTSFVKEFHKHPSESLARSFRARYSSLDVAPCGFEESGRFEKVVYLSYKCKEEKWTGFIYLGAGSEFWKQSSTRISLGEVLQIGKKTYLEIKPSFEDRFPEESAWDWKRHGKKESHPIRPQVVKEPKDNFGLQYFLSVAKHPAKRDLKSGKEIFFDSTCPLIFLKKDADFYWEKSVYYSFQASCISSSPYSYIRVRSDFLGKIRLDDKDTDQIQEGGRYLGKLKIHSLEADKILWQQDAELYNE